MKIYIGSDHTGFEIKEMLKTYLPDLGLGYEVIDKGAFAHDTDDDYPDFTTPVAKAVAENTGSFGIIIGGSGQGEAIVANRYRHVRAAVWYGKNDAILTLSREHNNANILSIGARFVNVEEAKRGVQLWLETKFSGDFRHEPPI